MSKNEDFKPSTWGTGSLWFQISLNIMQVRPWECLFRPESSFILQEVVGSYWERHCNLSGTRKVKCPEPAWGVPPVAKVMRLRGPTGKGESHKGASLDLLVHLPQNQSLPALLHYAFHLHFWHYRGLFSTTSLCKGVNLGLQLINLLGVFQSKNSSDGSLACLTGLSGHMCLFTASQPWETRDALNFLKSDSFEKLENY